MPLLDDEAATAYATLTATLRDMGLEWVLEQVADRVRQGKFVSKKVDVFEAATRDANDRVPGVRKSGRKETRESIAPFTPQEALRILVDAVDQAIVVVNRLEEHDVTWAKEQQMSGMQFLPDPEAGTPERDLETARRELKLDGGRAHQRAPINARLNQLLDELRLELPAVA